MLNHLAVKGFLQEQHVATVKWHLVLNNTMSTRPKSRGGPVVGSVEKCKRYTELALPPQNAGVRVATPVNECLLHLPHSFEPGDGKVVKITGRGVSRSAASEDACCGAMVQLLCAEPHEVVLRQTHWKMPLQDLVDHLCRIANMTAPDTGRQPLAAPIPRDPLPLSVTGSHMEKFAMVEQIVRRCLETHDGAFDPSLISRKKYGTGPNETAPWHQLDSLLDKGKFRNFIEQHPDFQITESETKSMIVTWATPHHSKSQSSPAEQTASSSSMDQTKHAIPGQQADSSSGMTQTLTAQMIGHEPMGQALPAQGSAVCFGMCRATPSPPGLQTYASVGDGQTLHVQQCEHVLVGQTLQLQNIALSSDIGQVTQAQPLQTLPVQQIGQLPMSQSLTQAAPSQLPDLSYAAGQNQGGQDSNWNMTAKRWKKRNE